ncbi:MAG TPA: DEAD/DEAH box helicase family protein, partial [Candidatus Gastranaerophilales bacterium]|nr:DEAD/DEAH box helicase family protein [Candidatus Gastranaerophilales bacterium]
TSDEALEVLKYAHFVSFWFYVLNGGNKEDFKPFEIPISQLDELRKLQQEQEQAIQELKKKLEENEKHLKQKPKTEADVIDFKKRSQEIAKYKEIELNEKQTRRILIDVKLKKLGWKIIEYRDSLDLSALDNTAVAELPTKQGFADYALFIKGKLLGFIEAKKIKTGTQNVIEQAKRYSKDSMQETGRWRDYKVPFLYSTNGEKIFFLDVRNEKNISRELSDFHTPDALNEFFNRESIDFTSWFPNNNIETYFDNCSRQPYPFQKKAIKSVEAAISNSQRRMMLAMATGTGKTYTTVSMIYRLLESKAVKRVLFLVDRKALAAQAALAFASFDTPKGNKFNKEYEVYSQRFKKEDFEEGDAFDSNVLPNEYLTKPEAKHTFVYVSTIQRMTINLKGKEPEISDDEGNQEYEIDDANQIDIPIHAFDMIIVDECHRGYTSKETNLWRDTINYFDAIKVGLTATPALHTVSYFNEPIYKYSVEEAVEDGFLVDYDDPIIIKSGVRINGVFLKEGEEVELIDTESGKSLVDRLEDEREFASTEVEKKITVPDSNRKIIQEIKKYMLEHEEKTGRFPKTLIFAANDLPHTSYSDEIVKICKEEFQRGDDFVCKITGSPSVDRPLQKIREFRNRPNPGIVVTVDMLSTGVDVPALEFIVFLRPIKSRILWEQMLGRGTRLCKPINKTHFTIVDCFEGTLVEYFKKVSGFDYKAPQKEVLNNAEIIEKIYKNEDRDYYTKALIRRLRRIEKNMSGAAYEAFEPYIDGGDIGRFATELKDRIANEFMKTMKILRDKDFQDLLINYPRPKRQFVRANEYEDTVSSERVLRSDGENVKPDDYINSFCEFVKNNKEQIEAIKILLEHPKDWKYESLKDLRLKLKQNKFDEKELQKAHNLVYHKALADIISMVKHAVKQEEPILTAEERVNLAINKIKQDISFNEEQEKWLGYIKEHLINNLSIEIDDFEYMPVFTDRGGLTKARKVFKNIFDELIIKLNSIIAA